MKLIKVCPNCNEIFETFKSINAIYCDMNCYSAFVKKKTFKKKNRPCAICGKRFVPVHPKTKGVYCSRKCAGFGNRKDKVYRSGYVYVRLPEHPFATKQGYVAKHRLIIENVIGRYLSKSEKVHHVNRQPDDNRIENLLLLKDESEHKIVHNGLKYGISKKEYPNEWWRRRRLYKKTGDWQARG